MFETIPTDARPMMDWSWEQIQPYFDDLQNRDVTDESAEQWLADWSRLYNLLSEAYSRLRLMLDLDTTDEEIEKRFFRFVEDIQPKWAAADQKLKEKFLSTGLEPEGLEVALRNMRAYAELYREENLPLFVEEQKMTNQYDKVIGAQSVEWDGKETPLPQLRTVFEEPDRDRREQAWRLMHSRKLEDREQLNKLWAEMFELRERIAANAGLSNYRDYVWQGYLRFDYTPEDCERFHDAIEKVCVPAATRLYRRHQERAGLETLRPWDLIDGAWSRPAGSGEEPPLKPYRDSAELVERSAAIFHQVDEQLGQQFSTMIDENLLDLDNRAGKAPGGYCTYFSVVRRPFIFMNAVGVHDDVQTMLHEAGHAFHAFEASRLPYHQQLDTPMEFNEVASMSMELLAAPYLPSSEGGFYSEAEAVRARVEHLEQMIFFWPYMAVVDAFQHWAYTHPEQATDAAQLDAKWAELYQRFIPALDWRGLDAELQTGWHRKLHIFNAPFYYVEYGLAALGAAQVWRNALRDQARAVQAYREALALGGTVPLPQLFETAGASFAFDTETVGQLVDLIEQTIESLEQPGHAPA